MSKLLTKNKECIKQYVSRSRRSRFCTWRLRVLAFFILPLLPFLPLEPFLPAGPTDSQPPPPPPPSSSIVLGLSASISGPKSFLSTSASNQQATRILFALAFRDLMMSCVLTDRAVKLESLDSTALLMKEFFKVKKIKYFSHYYFRFLNGIQGV